MNESEGANEDVLDSLIGKSIIAWEKKEESGMHFILSDGRIVIILGFLAVYYPNEKVH